MHDMHTSRQLTRRGLLRVAGLAGVGLLAACQSTQPSQTQTAPTAAAPAAAATTAPGASTNASASITWSFWGDPNELPPNDEVIQAFNQKYPNIEIKKFHEPFASYFDKIQTMFAGDSAPDVLFLNNIPSYASKNVLEQVDSLAQQSGYDVQDFVEAELQLFRFQGKLYGFPRDNDTKVLYFNKDAFDEVGLGYPDEKWNWTSLRDAANKLTKRQGDRIVRYGAAIEATEWPVFVWQNGAEVYDDALKPTKCLLDQPDQAAAVSYLSDFMNTDKVSPNATALTQAGGVTNLFGSGLAAMAISNAPRLLSFASATFKWDVAVLPQQKKAADYVGGAGYVMSSSSKQKEAAWTFMQFLNGPDAQKIFSKGGGVVPARVSVQKSDTFLKGGPPGVNMQAFVTATSQGHLNAQATIGPWQSELNTAVNKDMDPIWSGETPPADQLKTVVSNANAKLKQLVT